MVSAVGSTTHGERKKQVVEMGVNVEKRKARIEPSRNGARKRSLVSPVADATQPSVLLLLLLSFHFPL
jgi:hypothetical protein